MAGNSKSGKLFNLGDMKNQSGSINKVDIFQWKNTLLDNLKKEKDFQEHCLDTSKWDVEKVPDRGFVDTDLDDVTSKKKAAQVHSMLTKTTSYLRQYHK